MYTYLRKSILNKKILLSSLFLASLIVPSTSQAIKASSDTLGGYSAKVLEKVLEQYIQPVEARGSTLVLLRIAKDGRPYSCEIVKHSSNKEVDEALCVSIARVGKFEEPQGLANVEVALSFIYEDLTHNNMNAKQVLANPLVHTQRNVQNTKQIPAKTENAQSKESLEKTELERNLGNGVVQKKLNDTSTELNKAQSVKNQLNQAVVTKSIPENFTLQDAVNEIEKRDNKNLTPTINQVESERVVNLSFAQELLENVKPYLQELPALIPQGKYKVKYRIKTNINGQLTALELIESSNNYDYDVFVQDIMLVKNVIPKPRDGKNQEAIISFFAQK